MTDERKIQNLCIVQARMGSTRLPGKVLMDLCGKSVLQRVLDRTAASTLVSEVIVATGIGKENLPIVSLCAARGIRVFCGSDDDVLDRFYQLAKLSKPDNIVRITADCPLMDPKIIDFVVRTHMDSGADYTTNTGFTSKVRRWFQAKIVPPTFPDGEDVEVFTFRALERAWEKAGLMSEREHVTPYIRKHHRTFKRCNVENTTDMSGERWTLDNPEDLEFITAVYKHFKGRDIFGMTEIMEMLSAHPELRKLNSRLQRNEGYIKSLKEDKPIN